MIIYKTYHYEEIQGRFILNINHEILFTLTNQSVNPSKSEQENVFSIGNYYLRIRIKVLKLKILSFGSG